ncbi:MAG TPA: ABC transporter ATP-binding protein [Clostridia bacterium]|nr:ABC transporter ATP-binding protein [Clostridia bacterium]
MAAIETVALEKRYPAGFWRKTYKQALHPLSLTVEEGEVFGYLGPNGAGKTTTLKLLMGLVFPTGGTARILGRELHDATMKAQIGFLPEQPYFYDHLTGTELLNYYAQLSGVPPKERRRRAEEVLRRVGLPEAQDTQLRKYSKGMLQRIGIAQAIVHDPKLVFLDEPMSGLDPIGRREVRDLIQSLKDEGKTIFFSTHILSDAEALCDRVAVLNKGRLRGIGVVADLVREVSGRVEIMWEGAAATAGIVALGGDCHASGDVLRATVPESRMDEAIDAVRHARARLISVTPVRVTLEDYFVSRLEAEQAVHS